MKRLFTLILFVLNLVLLQAQGVKFISVNGADTTLENIPFKKLPKLLQSDTLRPDTLATATKWMLKLQNKLSKGQRRDSNVYIFFCPSPQDSIKAFLPLYGKYAYVLFDKEKAGAKEIAALQERLRTGKYQWDGIHDPQWVVGWLEDEDEGAMSLPCVGWLDDCDDVLKIMETFRNARVKGNHVKIKGQTKTEERTLVANSVKIGDADYNRVRLIYKPKTEDYSFNPTKYNDYDQQFFVADGSVDWQRGFIYYKDKEELFKILVDDDVSKIGKLKDYLFGGDKQKSTQKDLITLAQLQLVFKDPDQTFLSQCVPYLNKYMSHFKINTPLRIYHFLAQIGVETGYFKDDASLNEYTFRFYRRTSTYRGLLFHRLVEQAMAIDPVTKKEL